MKDKPTEQDLIDILKAVLPLAEEEAWSIGEHEPEEAEKAWQKINLAKQMLEDLGQPYEQ